MSVEPGVLDANVLAYACSRRIPIEKSGIGAIARDLLRQLDPSKLAAVVHLPEVVVHDHDEEPITDEDRRRFHEGQAWFAERGGKGIPMQDVLAEFALIPKDFPPTK